MLTTNEVLVLKTLQKKAIHNESLYYSAREIGEDRIFQSRSTPLHRATMSAGNVLGKLRQKGFVDLVLLVENTTTPSKFYKINFKGSEVLKKHEESTIDYAKYERLRNSYRQASSYAGYCLDEMKKIERILGMK